MTTIRLTINPFDLDVKITPCTVASLSTGTSKTTHDFNEKERMNLLCIGRPIPSEASPFELKTAQQDLAGSRKYSIIERIVLSIRILH